MSATTDVRPTAEAVAAALEKLGLRATVDGPRLHLSTGVGNLVCMAVNALAEPLPFDVVQLLAKACLHLSEQGHQQYFFRCQAIEASRKLTDGVTMHGENDSVLTFPSPGWNRSKGSFADLPELTWKEYCRVVDWILQPVTPTDQEAPLPSDIEIAEQQSKLTEANVAMLFEARYKDLLRYCEMWGKWLQWTGNRWKIDNTLLAHNYTANLCYKLNIRGDATPAKASFARGVEFLSRSKRSFATTTDQWDTNGALLNCPDSITDLFTGQSRKHAQTDYVTKISNVSPTSGPHPVFDMFMRDICLGDEALVQYHQRALGACLSGATQDNFLLFWYGTGQNGKNTFGELIEWILGDYCKVIPAETLMADKSGPKHPTELANLRGIRLAISSEVEEGSYFNEQRIKSLTGDATISARFMRQDFFEFKRTHKHLVYGNHRPMLRALDPAIKSRLHIVPFKAFFPPDARDPSMPARLRAEAPAILSWMIDGHSQWLEDGYLRKCSAVQAETDSYFEAQSTPDMWLSEACNLDPEHRTPAKELFTSFKNWKESRGEGVMSQSRWGEWMASRGFIKTRYSAGIMYVGVSLRQVVGMFQG